MMVPKKSLSLAAGIGPKMLTWKRKDACGHCTLRRTCKQRVT